MIDERKDDKQTEVIAEKSRKTAYIFLALMALGVAVVAAGVILLIYVDTANSLIWELCIVAVGAVLLATFGGLYISRLFRPYALITLQEGKLKFPDGTVADPREISTLEKDKGKITVSLSDRKIAVSGVANGDKAYRKLCVLTGLPVQE